MTYRVIVDSIALDQILQFAGYLGEYGQDFASEQVDRLDRVLLNIGASPLIWGYQPIAGPPFRGYLFRVGRRIQYWIIYTVDEDRRIVDVLQFWNTSRDPESLDL